MKTKLLLIGFVCLTSAANAASCLSASQQKTVDRNFNNSKENYGYINIDCNSAKLKNFCSDSYNVKMLNTLLRMDVYDYENATHTELTGNAYKSEYGSSFEWITRRYDNCSQLKSSLIEIMSTSIWAN